MAETPSSTAFPEDQPDRSGLERRPKSANWPEARSPKTHSPKTQSPKTNWPDSTKWSGWEREWNRCQPALEAFLRQRLPDASDRDDCLQTVLIRAIERGSDVAPALRKAWLFRVAANESALIWRKRNTEKGHFQQIAGELRSTQHDELVTPSDQSGLANVTKQESLARIQNCLQNESGRTQQIFHLRFNEDRTFQQIADELGIPLGTALTTVRRTLQRIRKQLDDED